MTIKIPFYPVDGWPITKQVGAKGHMWADDHKGTDFGSIWKDGLLSKSIMGEPFKSVFPGVVQKSGWHMIKAPDGNMIHGPLGLRVWVVSEVPEIGLIRCGYCHASILSVVEGVHVDEGQVLGFVGNTGNSSAPHLHFQIETWPDRKILTPELNV